MKSTFVLIVVVVTMVTALPENREYLKAYVRGYEDTKRELMDEEKSYHREDIISDNQVGTLYRDCSGNSFSKGCRGCRGFLSSCCTDSNCSSGRRCKAGIWSYSCDN